MRGGDDAKKGNDIHRGSVVRAIEKNQISCNSCVMGCILPSTLLVDFKSC